MKYNEATRSIETSRLLLRPFMIEDTEAVVTHCRNVNVTRNTLALPHGYGEENYTSWLVTHEEDFKLNKMYNFAISLKESGELIGSISVSHHAVHHRGELGYWLGEPFWNNGYATEAAQAILYFAYHYTPLNRIYAYYMAHNTKSANVMQKVGMNYEGMLKQLYYVNGEYIDYGLYAITKDEYKKLQP